MEIDEEIDEEIGIAGDGLGMASATFAVAGEIFQLEGARYET